MLFDALQLLLQQVLEQAYKAEVIIDSLQLTGHGQSVARPADCYVGALQDAPGSVSPPVKTIA